MKSKPAPCYGIAPMRALSQGCAPLSSRQAVKYQGAASRRARERLGPTRGRGGSRLQSWRNREAD
jgi:hypothetical protein